MISGPLPCDLSPRDDGVHVVPLLRHKGRGYMAAQRSGIARRSGVRGLPSILRTVSSGCVGIGMMPSAAALAGLPISGGAGPNPRLETPGAGTTAVPKGLAQPPPGAGPAQSGNLPGTGKHPVGQLDSVSAQIANLLPMANPGLEQVVGGVYVGDGRPPVPPKLAAKIRRWEFVDMGELLTEFWSGPKEDEPTSRRPATGRRSRKVTDILTWGAVLLHIRQCPGSSKP